MMSPSPALVTVSGILPLLMKGFSISRHIRLPHAEKDRGRGPAVDESDSFVGGEFISRAGLSATLNHNAFSSGHSNDR